MFFENEYKEKHKMIVMDIKIDNFFAFRGFHMNMSYPKKIVKSYVQDEYLEKRPNFRYKKVNILMGANATGKTSFGKMLMIIFNFMDKKQFDRLVDVICDSKEMAFFSMDFITDSCVLYRIETKIAPKSEDKYRNSDIYVCVKQVEIKEKDSYESCSRRLDNMPDSKNKNYIEELETLNGLSWMFEYPFDSEKYLDILRYKNVKNYLDILETTLKALDPSIKKVERIEAVEDSYVIRMNKKSIIIQEGKTIKTNLLSSGTKEGIQLAGILTSIINGSYGFYYCDEKFSYIHSDLEKAFLIIMIQSLRSNDQLFFTTHNTDILDLPLPKHSFTFLRKEVNDLEKPIKCISASYYLKRNTDMLRNAVENDLFSAAPSVDLVYKIADFK